MDRAVIAQECRFIEAFGGNVREFLRQQGFVSPWGTWYRLQREQLRRGVKGGNGMIQMGIGDGAMTKFFPSRHEMLDACLAELDAGRSPLPMLTERGYANPGQAFRSLRKWAETDEPEDFKRLPADLRAWSKKTKEEKKMKPEDLADVEEEATVRPLMYDGMAVMCLKGQCGTYFWDPDHNALDFDNGSDCLSLSPASWRILIDELTKAARVMGVVV